MLSQTAPKNESTSAVQNERLDGHSWPGTPRTRTGSTVCNKLCPRDNFHRPQHTPSMPGVRHDRPAGATGRGIRSRTRGQAQGGAKGRASASDTSWHAVYCCRCTSSDLLCHMVRGSWGSPRLIVREKPPTQRQPGPVHPRSTEQIRGWGSARSHPYLLWACWAESDTDGDAQAQFGCGPCQLPSWRR